eukprot:scaffold10388_cov157-Ochromonas_danica.AAC.1
MESNTRFVLNIIIIDHYLIIEWFNVTLWYPRDRLENHYLRGGAGGLDDSLPFDLGDKLFAQQPSLVSELQDQEEEVQKTILRQFFREDRESGTSDSTGRL